MACSRVNIELISFINHPTPFIFMYYFQFYMNGVALLSNHLEFVDIYSHAREECICTGSMAESQNEAGRARP